MLQSIVYDTGRVHVTWMDPASEDEWGVDLRVSVINVRPELESHLAELADAAEQLVAEAAALKRQRPR